MSGHNEANVALLESRAAICFALSLAGVIASLLFLQIYFGPKNESFGALPLVYSIGSMVSAAVLYLLSVRYERQSTT